MHICAIITRGAADGSFSYNGVHLIQTTGVIANAVDTNGAWDIFTGAFLYAINSGHNFVWINNFAAVD